MSESNVLAMIRKIAGAARRRICPYWTDDDAIESDACLGYIAALRAWRPDGGAPFWAYASMKIRSLIRDGIRHDITRLHGATHRGYGPVTLSSDGEEPDTHPALLVDENTSLDDRDEIQRLLQGLDSRRRELIQRVHLGGETASAVAKDWGITEGRVSMIGKQAFAQMRLNAR